MRAYELVLVLRPSLSAAVSKNLITAVKSILKDFKFVKENEVGQKTLGYKIKKETNGYYWDFWIEGENAIPKDLEKKLIDNENVLRHLLLRKS